MSGKPVPVPTPDTARFWEGATAGELWIQRCTGCGRPYFYPRACCPFCSSREVEWFRASGRATLYSYVINQRPAPGWDGPYVIAVVQLEEGPRMLTNLVGVEPDPQHLELDMPLEVTFEPRGDVAVPLFRPAAEGARA